MSRPNRIAAGGAALTLAAVLTLLGLLRVHAASIGPNPVTGTLPVSQQGYSPTGSGGFTFNSTAGTRAYYVSSGGTAATSVACNTLTLTFAGTGVLSTNGGTAATSGVYIATAGTTTFTSPLTLSVSNLNALTVVGTGQLGYFYSN